MVYEALRSKGPVVRLGPNELLVNIVDGGIRTVHGGGFEKTQWYEFFMNHGLVNPPFETIEASLQPSFLSDSQNAKHFLFSQSRGACFSPPPFRKHLF